MRHDKQMPDPELHTEAQAFDEQINERVANGHIPDISHGERCEWFRNNPWRDPFYVKLTFGRIVQAFLQALEDRNLKQARVLEVGCGPGHASLEIARAGHDVHALDISAACIRIANSTKQRRPEDATLRLEYHCAAFEEFETQEPFDAVVFIGSLHHFSDPAGVLQRASSLLRNDGILFASEPVRHNFTRADATLIHLLRVLLSQAGLYFEEHPIPADKKQMDEALDAIVRQVTYTDDHNHNTQSPHDNECHFDDIVNAAKDLFNLVETVDDYSFIDCILGGLRGRDAEHERTLAQWLAQIDEYMTRTGSARPRQAHLLGIKR